jgi:hypothetical protein
MWKETTRRRGRKQEEEEAAEEGRRGGRREEETAEEAGGRRQEAGEWRVERGGDAQSAQRKKKHEKARRVPNARRGGEARMMGEGGEEWLRSGKRRLCHFLYHGRGLGES